MTMKEMFKKVEAYNEIAEMMMTHKACIFFYDTVGAGINGEHFKGYAEFSKYVRREYIKELADKILKADDWEMDGEKEIEMDGTRTLTFCAELSAH